VMADYERSRGRVSVPNLMWSIRTFGFGMLLILITSCSGGDDEDLRAYINSVKSRPAGRIAPVPEFKPYETFVYSGEKLRDPFSVYTNNAEQFGSANSDINLRPDMNRNKEALEEYPLDTLHFVGHLERAGERWAIITSPDHLVYRVKIGNHLGTNYGEIVAISETQIDIKEIIQDGLGGWIERDAALSLTE
jgi:type IV pilus assembly protein PilP